MKKSILIMFVLLLIVTLCACNNNDTTLTSTTPGTNNTLPPDTTENTYATDLKPDDTTSNQTETSETSSENTADLPQSQTPPSQPSQNVTTKPTLDTQQIIGQGTCNGAAGNWKLSADGTLTIYGTTYLEDGSTYPWANYANTVKKIVIEEGIKNIPIRAFEMFTALTEIVLPNSLEDIREYAFSNCYNLSNVTIPANVTKLATGAFTACRKMSSVKFAANSKLEVLNPGVFGQSGLKEFVAPPNLKTIKSKAFNNEPELETVILNGSIETIEPQAFCECRYLKKVVLGPNITSIGNYAFNNCTTITHYESYAPVNIDLRSLSHLTTVILGGDISELPSFLHCSSLQNITISSSITKIKANQFMGCSSLANFEIPNTVKVIEKYAFVSSGIQALTIPPSVEELGISLFNNTTLKEITFLGDPPQFNSNATDGVFSGLNQLTAYYPANNPEWTNDVFFNYGAVNITWIAK